MKNIANSLAELIGKTPLLQLNNYAAAHNLNASILAKLEYLNPGGSVKDRTAWAMIKAAEEEGKLQPGGVIIEPTSGNTGIGLASIAAARGYRLILTMPETMSTERRKLLAAYGAELVLTDGATGMTGAIAKAAQLAKEIPGAFVPGQFDNPANPRVHYKTTGPEIWEDSGHKVDILVAGIGTGGTITGTGDYLKQKNPLLQVVGVEPADSAVLSGGATGSHQLQGIGAGFVPSILNTAIYNEIIPVQGEQAFSAAQAIAQNEGLLVGISSGAAVCAATQIALRPQNAGKIIVVILADSGERYLSTSLFGV